MATKKYTVTIETESRTEEHEYDSLPEAHAVFSSMKGKEGVLEIGLHDLEVQETLMTWMPSDEPK